MRITAGGVSPDARRNGSRQPEGSFHQPFFICAENPNTGKLYSERQYEAVGNNLIDLARKAGFRTGEFTLLPHIRGQLQIMLAELTENERRDFSADAMTLLERLKNKSKNTPTWPATPRA